MTRYCILFLAAAGCIHSAAGQDSSTHKWKFRSINTVGWIKGASATVVSLQTVNGFQKNHLYLGAGVGTDHYMYSGIPLFADARVYVGKHPSAFFGYVDEGIHFATAKDPLLTSWGYDISFTNGLYSDVGLGYALSLSRGFALIFQAGWTYKRVTEIQSEWVRPTNEPAYRLEDRYIHSLNRLAFRIGFRGW
jgi:hypothetical protein